MQALKFRLLLATLCLALLGVYMALLGAQSQGDAATDINSFANQIPTLPAENIPLYPGAQIVQTEPRYILPDARVISFQAPGTVSEVASYYRRAMDLNGWDILSDYGDESIDFIWSDPNDIAPWGLDLDFTLSDDSFDGVQRVYGIMRLRRVPDPGKVPMYPDARPLETTIGTTYETSASLNELETFYKKVMPIYGWQKLNPPEGALADANGMHYTWRLGSVENLRIIGVTIIAKTNADSTTLVELYR